MGPFSGYNVGDTLRLRRDVGCWAPAGERVVVTEISGEGNGMVVRNISGERRAFLAAVDADTFERVLG